MKISITRDHLVPGIMRYDFPEELAKKTIKYLSSVKDKEWTASLIGDGDLAKHIRSSTNIGLDISNPELAKEIRSYLLACVKNYSKEFDVELFSDEGLTVLKYEDYDKYEYHVDKGPESTRAVSILIYLNPKSYEGGNTSFKYFNYEVSPESPSIVIFPSNYPYSHSAMPVEKGIKYIIVSWISDTPNNLMNMHGQGCACSRQ